MKPEQFMKLKKGDVLSYGGEEFVIDSIEESWRGDLGFEAPHTLTNDFGQTIKISDPWLDEVLILSAAYLDPKVTYLRRLEYVVAGIDEGIKAWEFIDEAVEELIEQYGGYIVEIDG